MNEILNIGIFDISNGIPIDIKSYGKENKNKEILSLTSYIKDNIDIFKNCIIVADRGYFSYEFLQFLIDNNIKFIIRIKKNGDNLDSKNVLKPSTPKYNMIINIRNNTRLVRYNNIIDNTIHTGGTKKNPLKHIA